MACDNHFEIMVLYEPVNCKVMIKCEKLRKQMFETKQKISSSNQRYVHAIFDLNGIYVNSFFWFFLSTKSKS